MLSFPFSYILLHSSILSHLEHCNFAFPYWVLLIFLGLSGQCWNFSPLDSINLGRLLPIALIVVLHKVLLESQLGLVVKRPG